MYFWGNNITNIGKIVNLNCGADFHTFEVSKAINIKEVDVINVTKELGGNCKSDLITLNLWGNYFTAEGVKCVTDAMKQCSVEMARYQLL